jgi:hypothetical protein
MDGKSFITLGLGYKKRTFTVVIYCHSMVIMSLSAIKLYYLINKEWHQSSMVDFFKYKIGP